ncbi:penicillin-binding transpeptidase domain-containing protein [Pseudoflavonifractor sp. MSJ-37]|uniref:penicillin-binding transpeptidase domain-containing protein n=1 Tax=Pseudoflavonifractor sp. MSJ-37 TaxID=2841531 RepID=UPI001C12836F|nr:penicillin-binding transpeptidase domain-containing protein [Pseudoflavonifractor sp. MSJ-37]MBU5434306.1 PASTA domain-containing protein [Pseudoflavonifractor sp. MSJ-37]
MKNDKKRQKPDRNTNRTVLRRTLFLMAMCGVVSFVPLIYKLYDLQIRQHDELQARALDQQTWDQAVTADRGTIYDSKGTPLAMSAEAYYIQLSPNEILQRQKEYDDKVAKAGEESDPEKRAKKMPSYDKPTSESIAQHLAAILDLDEADILKRLAKTESKYEIIKTQVERETADQVREYASGNGLSSGIYVQPSSKRYYPNNSLAAQVIGWVQYEDNSASHGAYGMEAIYDDELGGKVGRVVTAKTGKGTQMLYRYEDYEDAVDGNDLHLTIDATIQYYCERILAEGIEKFDVQNGGFAIAMDPKTGAILAWANSPTYDLNTPRTITDPILKAKLEQIQNSNATDEEKSQQSTELLYDQWSNKAINEPYEPGSTFKSMVLAAALEEGVVNENSSFYCSGVAKVADWSIRCSKRTGHGAQTLAQAVANSCNPAFIAIGQKLGAEKFYDYLEDFGFLSQTGIDMMGEPAAPNYNIIWPRDRFTSANGLTNLATASFGQRFKVTPIQLLTAASSVVNGGHLMKPYVMDSITDADGNVIESTEPTEIRQVISEQTSERCRSILEGVVKPPGTGKAAYVAGYRIGGKTGSSETDAKDHTIVSFLGFAPANDPQVIVLLAYDNPKPVAPGANVTAGGWYISGGNMAAPQAGKLLTDILDYMGVAKQYTDEEKAVMDMPVPSLVGMSLTDAAARLKENGLDVRTEGEGDTVTAQIPAAGVSIPGGSKVILYMGAEKPTDKVAVPNVVGLSRTQAQEAMTSAGLYLKSTGLTIGSDVKAESQGIASGTEVERGTVVEVHFIQSTSSGGAGTGL